MKLKQKYQLVFFILISLFIVMPKSVSLADEYFQKGKLTLIASDNDGNASVKTYVKKWDDEKRKWISVISKEYTRDGRCDYSLAPGVYQLKMYYTEASPNIERVIEGIQISDKSTIEKHEYFEKGKLQLTATDHDGWASVKTFVKKWNDEGRKWESVISKEYTRDGRCDYSLAPGVYQLKMYYTEASPNIERVIEGIQISDKSTIEKHEYFEKGKLQLTATDHDGWASVKTFVKKWNDEGRKWESVISKEYTRDGRCDYSLAPGVYQLKMYYTEADPNTERIKEGIKIQDRQTITIGEDFNGGNLPPIISAAGPFEIGDGDGYYEIGEKALFRIDIRDSDLDSIEFLINDKVTQRKNKNGKYEQTISLEIPGEYRFAVRAKDQNGTLETFGRSIPVSMQKDRIASGAKHLSAEYGEEKVVMKCPKCGKEYTSDTHYCPDDGTKLNAIEKVIHSVMDTSLAGAGIDPNTPEAKNAKEFGLDWLNPFTSQEKIDEDIQRIVDDVMQK